MTRPPACVVSELYAAPLRQFVRARDARAAALARDGHGDEARAVKQLRRPAVSLWATNQLARVEPRGLAAFLDAVDRIRATQVRDPGAAAEAIKEQRAQLAALLRRAGEVLSGEGHRPTPALDRRISDTLLGAAVDRGLADDLRHGRLSAEVPAPGFEALMGTPRGGTLRLVTGGKTRARATVPAKPTRPAATRARAAEARTREAEARRREQAEARAQEAARHEAAASELERESAAREAAASRLEREVEAAATALAEKRRALRQARHEAKRAAVAARRARRAAR
jgi:hypothetical protein